MTAGKQAKRALQIKRCLLSSPKLSVKIVYCKQKDVKDSWALSCHPEEQFFFLYFSQGNISLLIEDCSKLQRLSRFSNLNFLQRVNFSKLVILVKYKEKFIRRIEFKVNNPRLIYPIPPLYFPAEAGERQAFMTGLRFS